MPTSLKRAREEGDDTHRVLYSYWRSSCSWRVRMALEFKGLSYEYKAINLLKGEDGEPEYFNMNPAGVPTLVDGKDTKPLTQSMAILEYLEEKYPAKPLLPRSFEDRAAVRSICLLIVTGIQPIQNLGILQKIEAKFGAEHKMPWAKEIITEGLQAVENAIAKTAGKFCYGDELTMADLCLVPQIYNAGRFGVDTKTLFPTITKVMTNIEPLEVAKNALPTAMPDATA